MSPAFLSFGAECLVGLPGAAVPAERLSAPDEDSVQFQSVLGALMARPPGPLLSGPAHPAAADGKPPQGSPSPPTPGALPSGPTEKDGSHDSAENHDTPAVMASAWPPIAPSERETSGPPRQDVTPPPLNSPAGRRTLRSVLPAGEPSCADPTAKTGRVAPSGQAKTDNPSSPAIQLWLLGQMPVDTASPPPSILGAASVPNTPAAVSQAGTDGLGPFAGANTAGGKPTGTAEANGVGLFARANTALSFGENRALPSVPPTNQTAGTALAVEMPGLPESPAPAPFPGFEQVGLQIEPEVSTRTAVPPTATPAQDAPRLPNPTHPVVPAAATLVRNTPPPPNPVVDSAPEERSGAKNASFAALETPEVARESVPAPASLTAEMPGLPKSAPPVLFPGFERMGLPNETEVSARTVVLPGAAAAKDTPALAKATAGLVSEAGPSVRNALFDALETQGVSRESVSSLARTASPISIGAAAGTNTVLPSGGNRAVLSSPPVAQTIANESPTMRVPVDSPPVVAPRLNVAAEPLVGAEPPPSGLDLFRKQGVGYENPRESMPSDLFTDKLLNGISERFAQVIHRLSAESRPAAGETRAPNSSPAVSDRAQDNPARSPEASFAGAKTAGKSAGASLEANPAPPAANSQSLPVRPPINRAVATPVSYGLTRMAAPELAETKGSNSASQAPSEAGPLGYSATPPAVGASPEPARGQDGERRFRLTPLVEKAGDLAGELKGRVIVRPATREATVQLDPPRLGEVRIEVRVDESNRMHATLTAASARTAELLTRQAGELRTALAEAGIRFDQFAQGQAERQPGASGWGAADDHGQNGRHAAGGGTDATRAAADPEPETEEPWRRPPARFGRVYRLDVMV